MHAPRACWRSGGASACKLCVLHVRLGGTIVTQFGSRIPDQKVMLCTQQVCFTTCSFAQQLGVDPLTIETVQLAAPLIPSLRQKRLTEFVWRCSWPVVIEGFLPFWLYLQLTAASNSPDSVSPSSPSKIAPADKQLRSEASWSATQMEKRLYFRKNRSEWLHPVPMQDQGNP